MGGDGSATDGCRQQQRARYLTATPSAAGKLPSPSAQSPPASWTSTTSAWTTAAGRGCCMMHVTAWRSLPLSAESSLRLLPAPLPLLRHVSLDARLAPGGGNAIKGGGRLGQKGGLTALSPAFTHPQPTKSPPRLSRLPLVKPPQQQTPRCRQHLHPRRRSWHRHRRLRHLRRSLSPQQAPPSPATPPLPAPPPRK
jgi:hypothetical protein